jgi:hypothetical protein
MSQITFQELIDELRRLSVAIEAAKRSMLAAQDHYSSTGHHPEQQVKQHVARYADPAERRARQIREAAESTLESLRAFDRANTRLLERLAILLLQTSVSVSKLTLSEIEALVTQPGHLRLAHLIIPSLPTLNETEGRQILSMAQAVVIGRATENVLGVATTLVQLHQGRLEQFAGENLSIDLNAVLRAMTALFHEKATDGAFETLAKAALEALKLSGVPLLPLVTLGWEIGKKLQEVNQHYTPRNDADDLLEFSDQLAVEVSAAGSAVELVHGLIDALQNPATPTVSAT